ncbi:MAG: polysaccharide pyruvyl transferase family protein [Candidatus Omnitrophota bacterium]
MKLFYWKNPFGVRNFGDDLNPWLWSRLLPGFFDEDPDSLFVGIGTILNDKIPETRRITVFSSGAGYSAVPAVGASWKFYCVRGPLTARLLGLPKDKAVLDGAVLVKNTGFGRLQKPEYQTSFMPHVFMANESGPVLKKICDAEEIHFIDPRRDVPDVLLDIGNSGKLITEALHGAILADALRIPWVRVRSNDVINDFKWDDWAGSLDLELKTKRLLPVWGLADRSGILKKARRQIKIKLLAAQIRAFKRGDFYLSNGRVLAEKEKILNECLSAFIRDCAHEKRMS